MSVGGRVRVSNDNDPFVSLMNRADPAPVLSEELDLRARYDLSHILASDAARPASPNPLRRLWFVTPGLAFTLLAVMLVVQPWNWFGATDSAAATPRMLQVTASELRLEDAMSHAIQTLQSAPLPVESERRSNFEGWFVQIAMDDTEATTVLPEESQLVWNEDLSGALTVIAGRSFTSPHGDIPEASSLPAGTRLRADTFGAGEVPVLFQGAPPTDPTQMRDYLATGAGLGPDADAAAVVEAVRILLSEWTLTGAQHAAILTMLSGMPGLSLEGTVVDRLDRAAQAIRVIPTVPTGYEKLLLLSTDTGQVIGLETIYIGGIPELKLQAPAVASYIAWK